jgi:hypothetical protein
MRRIEGEASPALLVKGATRAPVIANCGGGAWMDVHFSVLGNEIP